MSGSKPLYWYEGLFLRPQHFQQQDQFHLARLQQAIEHANPYPWGLISLAVSQPRLNNQVFEIENCSAVFQDGTAVSFPGNAKLMSRSFEGMWGADGKPLSVYLGLRRPVAGESNVITAADEAQKEKRDARPRRFISLEDPPTYDLYAQDIKEPIAYLTYNLQIMFGNEVLDAVDFDVVKVMELQRIGNEVKPVEDYIPAFARTRKSAQLSKIMKNLCEHLTTRTRELALYKQDRGLESAAFGTRDMVYLLALQTLNRYVPPIFHLTDEGDPTSWQLYNLLRQLAAELTTFSPTYDLFGAKLDGSGDGKLPKYDHENLGRCFDHISRFIVELLEELTAGPDYTAGLVFDGTYYYADVIDRIFQGGNRYFLCLKTSLPEDFVANALAPVAKVASKEILPLLIARSLPGIRLEYLPSPPTVLPRRGDTYYFAMDINSEVWSSIKEGRNIAAYLDNPPADLEVELMVVYG